VGGEHEGAAEQDHQCRTGCRPLAAWVPAGLRQLLTIRIQHREIEFLTFESHVIGGGHELEFIGTRRYIVWDRKDVLELPVLVEGMVGSLEIVHSVLGVIGGAVQPDEQVSAWDAVEETGHFGGNSAPGQCFLRRD